jgi:hypothetical protein
MQGPAQYRQNPDRVQQPARSWGRSRFTPSNLHGFVLHAASYSSSRYAIRHLIHRLSSNSINLAKSKFIFSESIFEGHAQGFLGKPPYP